MNVAFDAMKKRLFVMIFTFSKELYPKSALIKCAYRFTDRAFVHLDANETEYIVTLTLKEGAALDEREFENEMLAQTARYEIYRQTKDIRRLTVARALASTVVEEVAPSEPEEEETVDLDNVLKDWFETHEQS